MSTQPDPDPRSPRSTPSKVHLPPYTELDEDGDPIPPRIRKRRSSNFPLLACGCMGLVGFAVLAFGLVSSAGIVATGLNFSSGPGGVSLKGQPLVAVVRVEGPIMDSKPLAKQLKTVRRNSQVRALVVRIDSPGGAVGASEEMWRDVLNYKKETGHPVVISMGNAAASGGYYLATAGDLIYANGGTITGSIGVIVQGVGFSQLLERAGLEGRTIKSGEMKDAGSPFRPMGAEEKAYFQGVVFDMYRQFFRRVLESRWAAMKNAMESDPQALDLVVQSTQTKRPGAGLEWEAFTTGSIARQTSAPVEMETALRRLADGRILTGEQAHSVGLVDELGGLTDATNEAARLAKLGKDKWGLFDPEPRPDLSWLLGNTARQALQETVREQVTLEYR